MVGKHRTQLLCLLLAVCLLISCGKGKMQNATDPDQANHSPAVSTLTVYSPEKYRAALQQIFSHINLVQSEFSVSWTESFLDADMVIADSLPKKDHGAYRVLDPEKLQVQGIDRLALFSEQGMIGVPLFLCIDGFWYDRHLYDRCEAEVPQSLDAWQASTLRTQYPTICDKTDMCALFWSVVAPYYLKNGGTVTELSEGNFNRESLLAALQVLQTMKDSGFVQLTDQAWQTFTSMQAAYWLTSVDKVAAYYNHTSNQSSWNPSLTLPFGSDDQAICVIRADVLAVRESADPKLADRFLELFFNQRTLADLSNYSRMPIACRMTYTPDAIPKLAEKCYTMMASSMVELVQVSCMWEAERQQKVWDGLLNLLSGNATVTETMNAIM